MRTPILIALIFMVVLAAGLLVTGCANDQNQAIAQTMAALTKQAMALPVITFTPVPTLAPTENF